jgi:hypothetical protein
MKRSHLAIVAAIGLLSLAGTPAWASPTPTPQVGWTYNFTPSQSFLSGSPGGTVSFTNESQKTATNSSNVVVTNLRVTSTASPTSPDVLNSSNGSWQVSLKLTDNASGNSDTMNFTGKLTGTFSQSNANIGNAFTGTQSYTWTAPGSGNIYKVSLVGYTPPGPPTDANAGSIAAYVQVTPGSNGGGHTGGGGTPEPSTMVLSCLGLGFAGLASWRKRRRSLAAMLA